ncbi:hypothetical protein GDO81_021108 [Engystomops pustulosus]|uniref:Uncharacterized protein n=1 Tax=Engystomops pustulosus TaxID=76066 RepID=A0AAV6YWE4_ENGPU|nr:hypothetical protein GDO81_021108 [Engystomops pustulosus]
MYQPRCNSLSVSARISRHDTVRLSYIVLVEVCLVVLDVLCPYIWYSYIFRLYVMYSSSSHTPYVCHSSCTARVQLVYAISL